MNHIDKHPHHSSTALSNGMLLYNYQNEACKTVLLDFQLCRGVYKVIKILKIPTGDGKTFISENIVNEVLDLDDDTSKKTIFLCSPLIEVLEDIKEKMISLKNKRNDIELYFDKEERDVESIKNYNNNPTIDSHKIFVFSDQWAERNSKLLPTRSDFTIRDESKGVNVSSEEEARIYLGEYNWLGKWYNKLMSHGGYVLVLNATPTDAQKNSKKFHILDIDVDMNFWKKPFLNESKCVWAKTSKEKEKLVKSFVYDFLTKNIQFRYNVDLINNKHLNKRKKLSAMIKCSSLAAKNGLTTTEVKRIIVEYNQELTGKIIEIEDPKTKEVIQHEYDGDLLHPIIKDQHHSSSIKSINNPLYKENILIVCELGTYGVNIKNCSHLLLLRDTINQHIGKTYTAEQLFSRLKRNLWDDWFYMIDYMIETSIETKDYEWIRDTFMDVAGKHLWFLQTKVNDKAFNNFISQIPNREQITETVDNLVLNEFNWLPDDKNFMDSKGGDEDRNYLNVRNAKCETCDNLIFDVHFEKLLQRGYGKVVALAYAVKDIMQNAHTHTKDDETQRSQCISCHAIETRENKHYLPSDNPDRKKITN